MIVLDVGVDGADVHLSSDELTILNNALNEICHGLAFDDLDFHTRIGVERHEAQSLLSSMKVLFENSN